MMRASTASIWRPDESTEFSTLSQNDLMWPQRSEHTMQMSTLSVLPQPARWPLLNSRASSDEQRPHRRARRVAAMALLQSNQSSAFAPVSMEPASCLFPPGEASPDALSGPPGTLPLEPVSPSDDSTSGPATNRIESILLYKFTGLEISHHSRRNHFIVTIIRL